MADMPSLRGDAAIQQLRDIVVVQYKRQHIPLTLMAANNNTMKTVAKARECGGFWRMVHYEETKRTYLLFDS